MHGRRGFSAVPALCLITALLAGVIRVPPGEAQHFFVEDFTSTAFRDSLKTSGHWDTAAGQLHLHPFGYTLTGSISTAGLPHGIEVSGQHAYVADQVAGLTVLDISDVSNPVVIGNLPTSWGAMSLDVRGDLVFVADGAAGLRVIDVTDPAAPVLVGSLPAASVAYSIRVRGNHAYLADGGLRIVDVSNPATPTQVGLVPTAHTSLGVHVDGRLAFLADGDAGLRIIDVSQPSAPVVLGSHDTPDRAFAVFADGGRAYIADRLSGMLVFDTSDPSDPTLLATYDTDGYALGITVYGDRAFVADGPAGLLGIDISNAALPTLAGQYDTPDLAYGVFVQGRYAFVADQLAGVQIVKTSEATPASTVGSAAGNGAADDISLAGDYAFLALETGGLQVFDISNPYAPSALSSMPLATGTRAVSVQDRHAYIGHDPLGVLVVDIGNPTSPTLVATYSTNQVNELVPDGNFLYVVRSSTILLLDVSDPANPAFISSTPSGGSARSIAIEGDLAYVAQWTNGLGVMDFSNPASPSVIGTALTPAPAHEIAVAGNHAFVGTLTGGVWIFDVTDPTTPALVEQVDIGTVEGIAAVENLVYVSTYDQFVTLDVSNPSVPSVFSQFMPQQRPRNFVVSGTLAFLASNGLADVGGIEVLQVGQDVVDEDRPVAESTAIDNANDGILRARISATEWPDVDWELSPNDGVTWTPVINGGAWVDILGGNNLRWRATLGWNSGQPPSVSQVRVEWLTLAPVVNRIVDVPDDQGGWVRLYFARSGKDFTDVTALPVTSYTVSRRVDNPLLAQRIRALFRELPSGDGLAPEAQSVHLEGREFRLTPSGPAGAAVVWEAVVTLAARQEDEYVALLPTLADSSSALVYSVYRVTAHTSTPSIFYDASPDSGYSIDNIAPGVPQNIAAAYSASGVSLSWDPAPEPDFQFYRVYRGDTPEFAPSPANLAVETAALVWVDGTPEPWSQHYKLSAVDHAGNEGPAGAPQSVTGVPVAPRLRNALHPATPNPFNPSTTLRFELSSGAHVTLAVYDVAGSRVALLIDGLRLAGSHSAVWDGRNQRGQRVASGTYFCRLQTPDFVATHRLTLLK